MLLRRLGWLWVNEKLGKQELGELCVIVSSSTMIGLRVLLFRISEAWMAVGFPRFSICARSRVSCETEVGRFPSQLARNGVTRTYYTRVII